MKPLIVSTGDVLVLHPRDVVLRAVARLRRCGTTGSARAARSPSARCANGIAASRCRDDLRDLLRVAAVDLVDLLDELAVALHEARVQPVLLR